MITLEYAKEWCKRTEKSEKIAEFIIASFSEEQELLEEIALSLEAYNKNPKIIFPNFDMTPVELTEDMKKTRMRNIRKCQILARIDIEIDDYIYYNKMT